MTRIKVLEAIAGSDFSWAPGDLVDLPEEAARAWADGHRAELADDQEQDAGRVPSVVHRQPVVVDEDGQALDVLAATLEDIDPPAGQEDGPRWVQWSVTVRLPLLPSGPDGGGQGDDETEQADGGTPVASALFDPREHTNKEVLAYLDTVGYEEALRVLDVEANEGEPPRAGIVKNRDAVLEAARARSAAVGGGQAGAEKAADTSRGGGRADVPETRDW